MPHHILNRNGFARLGDLDDPSVQAANRDLENYQCQFTGATRSIWPVRVSSRAFGADALYTWSRQWEYAYVVANLDGAQGKILDAGSGLTFFPFFLSSTGHDVSCCDNEEHLAAVFPQVCGLVSQNVSFTCACLERLPYESALFDACYCVSVLEHVTERTQAINELCRVLKPAGRLVATFDVSLSPYGAILYEDFAEMISAMLKVFSGHWDLSLLRPPDLLTTTCFRAHVPWRLTTGYSRSLPRRIGRALLGRPDFYHLAVCGLTLIKR